MALGGAAGAGGEGEAVGSDGERADGVGVGDGDDGGVSGKGLARYTDARPVSSPSP